MRFGTFPVSELLRKAIKAARLLRIEIFRYGLRHGVAASIEHEGALSGLGVRTVVDIGANLGQFSLVASAFYQGARIYAFEPQSEPFETLTRLLPRLGTVKLYCSAIGTHSGYMQMHISRRHDNSSLLPISARMSELFPGTDEVAVAQVAIAPLASFLTVDQIVDPALLKIDVQGAELDVLRGCDDLLDRFRYVYVELSFVELYIGQVLCHDVIVHLDQKGFRLSGVYNQREDSEGRAVQADFLFHRAEKIRPQMSVQSASP